MTQTVRIGQFSESPVLAAARVLGLEELRGLRIERSRVPSSPAQFTSLECGDFDVAVTSPDNVLLYATTDRNPLGRRLPLRILRAIDHGLGLALVTRPEIDTVERLASATVAVDVLPSGFAMLLKGLLRHEGVDPAEVTFVEAGSTPRRLEALLAGSIDATILNAESRVAAVDHGMVVRSTSVDIAPDYLGTVLATGPDTSAEVIEPLLSLWGEATRWLLETPVDEVARHLAEAEPSLASPAYLAIARDPGVGLCLDPRVSIDQLLALSDLRTLAGAYAPEAALVGPLAVG